MKGRLLVAAGAALVIGATFAPFFSVALLGSRTLWQASSAGAWAAVAAGAVALIGAWMGWRLLIFCGALACAAITWLSFHHYHDQLAGVEAKAHRWHIGGLGRMLTDKVQLGNGAWLMLAGAVLVVLGAIVVLFSRKRA